MEKSIIEQLDRSRYNLMKWLTLGWIIWYGTFIFKELIENRVMIGLMLAVGLIGWVFFTINLIRLVKLGRKINLSRELKEALGNEMYRFYMFKSVNWGFWAIIVTVCLFIGLNMFLKISALMVCELILFVGVSSCLIANLAYNRE